MAVRYKTISKEAESLLVVEKSKFIGQIKPVETLEEAEAFIASIRVKHRDATHNVPVYLLGEKFETQKYSDDGEPSGTAGVPVLHMLMNEGVTNAAIVITRYFGGIKLGTGGLVRAYTGVAKQAVEEAGVVQMKDMQQLKVRIGYHYHGKIENMASKGMFFIQDTVFDDAVTVSFIIDPMHSEEMKKSFMEVTSGTCLFLEEKTILEKVSFV